MGIKVKIVSLAVLMTITVSGNVSATAGEQVQTVTPVQTQSAQASSVVNPEGLVNYAVTITTGTVAFAGTDASITLGIQGDSLISQTLGKANYDDFEAGSTATYYYNLVGDIGNVRHLTFWNHGGGDNPDWYVSKVVVKNTSTGQSWTFSASGWVNANDGYTMYY